MKHQLSFTLITLLAALPYAGVGAQTTDATQPTDTISLPRPEDPVVLPTDEEVARMTAERRAAWLQYLKHDPDGWDDLWVHCQSAGGRGEYQFNPGDEKKDTDGDGISDYEEMLLDRDATYAEPVLTKEQQIARIREERRKAIENRERSTVTWNAEQLRLTPQQRRVISEAPGTPKSGEIQDLYETVSAGYGVRMAQLRANENQVEAVLEAQSRLAGVPRVRISPDGRKEHFAGMLGGQPAFNSSLDAIAAAGLSADELWPAASTVFATSENAGLSVTGLGVTLGIWEADGAVRTTHAEFDGRVTQRETSPPAPNDHATGVAAMMIGVGQPLSFANNLPLARGAAFQATLSARTLAAFGSALPGDSGTAASPILLASNHSWGRPGGWSQGTVTTGPGVTIANQWIWGGSTATGAGTEQDFKYGFYWPDFNDGSGSTQIDSYLSADGLRHLMVYAAGNDRGNGPGSASNYYYPPSTTAFHTLRANPGANERDWRNGDDDTHGFDTVLAPGTCKNVLTVGACQDIAYPDSANPAQLLLGFTSTASFTMAAFSGCGPTDDGRIKPDVVSVGQAAPAVRGFGIVAPVAASDTDYSTGWAGTSFATPSVTGCVGLLLHRRAQLFPALNPLTDAWNGATLKAIVINNADDVLTPGPDYKSGYGVANALKMVRQAELDQQHGRGSHIKELTATVGQTLQWEVDSAGTDPLKWTLTWADKPGQPANSAATDLTKAMLVNNLDLKVERMNGSAVAQTYLPWVLNPDLTNTNVTAQAANRATAATTGTDNRNNVEQVYIAAPTAGRYRITVTHSGAITGGPPASTQTYSIVSTGDTPRAASITSLLRAPAGNQVTLNFAADPGAYFTVQTSTNLSTWTNDGSVYAAAVTNSVTRSASAAEPKRYWRLKRGQP